MAAEAAAGVWAAEEVVSTGVQVGVGAYMVSKPTMPLRAQLRQIATAKDDETRLSLARSDHTVTVVANKAYIFGGETASKKLASNDLHCVMISPSEKPEPEYSLVPAIPDVDDQPVPAARTRHAACKLNVCVAIFGGVNETGELVDEEPLVWLYVTAKSTWEKVAAENASIAPVQRSGAKLFESKNNLILYGGVDASGQQLKDVWHFDYTSKTWTPLPSAPISSSSAALAEGMLYLISGSDSMSSDIHFLNTYASKNAEWQSTSFPTNPLTPGPRPRAGGLMLPITTGYGRNYILYAFGARQNPTTSETVSPEETDDPTQWSDLWTYQVHASQPEAKATTSISEALKPSKIKDAIRSTLGFDTGEHSWAEVEVQPPNDLPEGEGKVHPGPRAFFGCDVTNDGQNVVVWGGLNAKGEREGDGWIIRLS